MKRAKRGIGALFILICFPESLKGTVKDSVEASGQLPLEGRHKDGVDPDEYSAANEARVGNVEVRPEVVANHDEDPVAYGVNRLSELFGGGVPDFNIEIGPAHPV